MGFGLLLIGYIFAYVAAIGFGTYIFAGMFIGGFIMFLGLLELRKYAPTFVYAIIADTLLLLCSVLGALIWLETRFNFTMGVSLLGLERYFDWAKIVIDMLFNISLLYGISDLSKRVDYPETGIKALRNMIFVALFNLLQLTVVLPIKALDSSRPALMIMLLILQLFYTVMNAALIVKCYAMICPEGQEDMKRKKSRFEFVNKWNKIQDEREEQVIEGTKKYFEDKIKKRNEKLNSKNTNYHHKKKKK